MKEVKLQSEAGSPVTVTGDGRTCWVNGEYRMVARFGSGLSEIVSNPDLAFQGNFQGVRRHWQVDGDSDRPVATIRDWELFALAVRRLCKIELPPPDGFVDLRADVITQDRGVEAAAQSVLTTWDKLMEQGDRVVTRGNLGKAVDALRARLASEPPSTTPGVVLTVEQAEALAEWWREGQRPHGLTGYGRLFTNAFTVAGDIAKAIDGD